MIPRRDPETAQRRRSAIYRARLIRENPAMKPHGNLTTYTYWGCRCGPCKAAAVAASQARDAQIGWPQPTRQRIASRGKAA